MPSNRFASFEDLAHGWEHVQRVYHLAAYLAEQEHADLFVVMLAALLLVGGSLGDIFGRKRIYVTGIIVFATASAGFLLFNALRLGTAALRCSWFR